MRTRIPRSLRERRRARADQHKGQGKRSSAAPRRRDPAVERVRSAGGPDDRASYACQCGYQFVAQVSTTVACPHCRAPQPW